MRRYSLQWAHLRSVAEGRPAPLSRSGLTAKAALRLIGEEIAAHGSVAVLSVRRDGPASDKAERDREIIAAVTGPAWVPFSVVANRYGITDARVSQIVSRHGVQPTRRSAGKGRP